MATNSPQAGIPNKRSPYQLLESLSSPQVSTGVLGPQILASSGEALPKQIGTMFRILQNCGTVPVKYLIDNENNASTNNFHGILAPCSVQDDGTGSIVNFNFVGDRVSIFVDSGSPRIAVFVGTTPDYIQA